MSTPSLQMAVKAIMPGHSGPLRFPADFLADDLQDHFKDKSVQEHGPLWDQLWQQQRTSWDRGGPSLALHETLTTYPELFDGTYPDLGLLSDFVSHETGQSSSYATAPAMAPRKKALVPACGRGYDAVLLAKVFGYDVIGLEISSSALDAARQYLNGVDEMLQAHQTQRKHSVEDNPAMRFWVENKSPSPGRVHWVSGDFFSDDWLVDAGTEQFDLIFDYTFFCAIPPSSRPQWAARMQQLLAQPSGRLVCLEFPTGKHPSTGGPPHSAAFWFYQLHLSNPGNDQVITYGEKKDSASQDPGRDIDQAQKEWTINATAGTSTGPGLAMIVRFKPNVTHESGQSYQGSFGRDWVSIWGHSLGSGLLKPGTTSEGSKEQVEKDG
ncbi:hypothetical protein INS49_012257 [Diaporthe citri]|uniref:uncharacterized protein n=1 Tax=Diaporthe citri TaxID=83186 RepID=UPI001C7F24A1|nr:uncharacterized protein INS49_012257 [Diaporthe citri]KAG6358738.1 hypothetical protein INS49_012257 [Diaporthe citri]